MAADHVDWFHRQLEAALDLLRADADRQVTWLRQTFPRQVVDELTNVDELGEQFFDAWMDGELKAFDALTDRVRERILRLDRALADISGADKAELWTVAALRDRPEWSEIRSLAGDALDSLALDTRGDFGAR